MSDLNERQVENFARKVNEIKSRVKPTKKYTMEEKVLLFLAARPYEWFFTWELMGHTEWGWLSHATHATLRKASREGLIIKDYINGYVVYTHKN